MLVLKKKKNWVKIGEIISQFILINFPFPINYMRQRRSSIYPFLWLSNAYMPKRLTHTILFYESEIPRTFLEYQTLRFVIGVSTRVSD